MDFDDAPIPGEIPPPPNLNKYEQAVRVRFVEEYIVDYDEIAACVRVGFMHNIAKEFSYKLMQEPYVLQLIQKYTNNNSLPQTDKQYQEYDKRRVINGLMREAHYRGPGSSQSARVNALKNLATLMGMEKPKELKVSMNHKGGVMVAPKMGNVDDWEAEASASQDALARHASDN